MSRMLGVAKPMLLVATLLAAGGAAPGAVKPWELRDDCHWWLSGDDGKSHRASIGRGETEIMLSFSDPVFATWPMEDRPAIELLLDADPGKRVQTTGWATHGSDGSGSFGLYLDAEALRKFAGATSLELRRDGRPVILLPLAGTPGHDALEACVPPPREKSADEE